MNNAPTEMTDEEASAKAVPPTYAPFFLALGITMLFWGLVTSWVMSAAGLVLLIGALWTWIAAIVRGWRN